MPSCAGFWRQPSATEWPIPPFAFDLVAELTDGAVLTGSVKWNVAPIGSDVHWAHIDMLKRAAHAGRAWAHQGLEVDAPILYAAAGGFADDFMGAIEGSEQMVTCWSLEDVYG